MKRKIVTAFLALILVLTLPVTVLAANNTAFVYDEANLLSRAEENGLSQQLQSISEAYKAQIVVVTVDSVENGDVDTYVELVYDGMGFGYGANHDGVLLLVCMDPREYRILSNGFAADAISGSDIDSIGSLIVSDLSDGEYADAFETFAGECEYYLDGHINGFPFNFGMSLVIALVVGLAAGLIVANVLKAQLKSVHMQARAHSYLKPGSMQLTHSNDIFLYRNVSRRARPKSSSSGGRSGGGSSRNVGGGSF